MRHLIAAFCLALACSPVLAADTPKKEPSEAQKAQQQKMKDCSAKSKGMKGAEHEKFMSKCLSGEAAPATKGNTAQQQRMKDCSARSKGMKGAEHEKFMSSCLSGKDAPATAAKADEKKANTQQDKMTKCNKDASAKALKGKERETFMSSCLKG